MGAEKLERAEEGEHAKHRESKKSEEPADVGWRRLPWDWWHYDLRAHGGRLSREEEAKAGEGRECCALDRVRKGEELEVFGINNRLPFVFDDHRVVTFEPSDA
jgi:hypothetical protein